MKRGIVHPTMVATALILFGGLAGCLDGPDGSADPPPSVGAGSEPPANPESQTWYLHHRGGCDPSASAYMDQNDTAGDDDWCAHQSPERLLGTQPIETYPASSSAAHISRGSTANGTLYLRIAGPGEGTFRLELLANGTVVGRQESPINLVGVDAVMRWPIHFDTTEDAPEGSNLSLRFYVSGLIVKGIGYDQLASYFLLGHSL